MRYFVLAAGLALSVLSAPVAADTAVKKSSRAPVAERAPKAEPPPPKAQCKRKVVGRGLERKVICELEAIVVTSQAPRPNVIVVQQGGRKVTGRPRLTDPFAGLSRTLE